MISSNPSTLNYHLSPVGLSGEVIDDLLRWGGISDHFLGIYAAPRLKFLRTKTLQAFLKSSGTRRRRKGCVLIINVGQHWITVKCDDKFVFYADSYGKPPQRKDVISFLRRCARIFIAHKPEHLTRHYIVFNPQPVQDVTSNYCGLYAALWALLFDRQKNQKITRSHAKKTLFWHKHPKQLLRNDKLCVKYLSQILLH